MKMRGLCLAALLVVGCLSAAEAAYSWRGYMLDVSRHFFTVPEIKRTLAGVDRALAMLRRLARPKLGGAYEFPGGEISE